MKDIKAVEVCNKFYPTQKQMEDSEEALKFLPPLLVSFLKVMMTGKDIDLKLASIGQEVIQATRPCVILAPLQFGIGIQMHTAFASRFLVDSLNKNGFACSYSKVQRSERSVLLQHKEVVHHNKPTTMLYSS